jgi:phospholipid/cholesterol/gamma-HCH transport system permease protein
VAEEAVAEGAGAEVVRVDPVKGERLRIAIRGRLDARTHAAAWRETFALAGEARGGALALDAAGITYCDGAGAVLLSELERRQSESGGKLVIEGLKREIADLLEIVKPVVEEPKPATQARPEHFLSRLGRRSIAFAGDLRRNVVFVGHVTVATARALVNPRSLRMSDVFRVAEAVGIGAIPIVALVGGLLGLILAFQSVISMERFGAEIYMADLLAISMVRELGPLMAAILLAARSGSAFAAEIGTMKVNEEVDALTTMGLEPVRFLIVPRVIAALAMTPVVALLTNFFGLLGGLVVWRSIGYPTITFINRAAAATTMTDFFGGLSKAFIFGIIVAAVGCLRGLQTGKGAGAVGESTTSSVVTCIVLIGVADGIFAVIFYVLGI